MRRSVVLFIGALAAIAFLCPVASAQDDEEETIPRHPAPDSEYFQEDERPKPAERGGFFDFLPFIGDNRTKVEPEKLRPSPLPKKSERVFSPKQMEELRKTAAQWLLASEFTEPTVRRDEKGKHYRDYIVFANEYEIEVLRGDSDDVPFIGHVYVKGDYFTTGPHDEPEEARSDFNFQYKQRDFRLVFERAEKWEYSDNPDEEPFMYREKWEFKKIQSRPTVEITDPQASFDSEPPGAGETAKPESE